MLWPLQVSNPSAHLSVSPAHICKGNARLPVQFGNSFPTLISGGGKGSILPPQVLQVGNHFLLSRVHPTHIHEGRRAHPRLFCASFDPPAQAVLNPKTRHYTSPTRASTSISTEHIAGHVWKATALLRHRRAHISPLGRYRRVIVKPCIHNSTR